MEITKNGKLVKVETTNRCYGMLEQGGVCGRIVGYAIDDVVRITGIDKDELEAELWDEDDECPSNEGCTVRQMIESHLNPARVFARGTIIQ